MQKIITLVSIIGLLTVVGLFATGQIAFMTKDDAMQQESRAQEIVDEADKEIKRLKKEIEEQKEAFSEVSENEEPKINYASTSERLYARNTNIALDVGNQFGNTVGLNEKRSSQMAGLMEKKLNLDLNDSSEMTFFYNEQQDKMHLFQADESLLSEKELEEKKALVEKVNSLTGKLEQNRSNFEKELNNLLSPEEIAMYQNEETRVFKDGLRNFTGNIVEKISSIEGVQQYQIDQINSITNSLLDQPFDDWSIGSRVNLQGQPISNSDPRTLDILVAYQLEIADYLTPDQMAHYIQSIHLETEEIRAASEKVSQEGL